MAEDHRDRFSGDMSRNEVEIDLKKFMEMVTENNDLKREIFELSKFSNKTSKVSKELPAPSKAAFTWSLSNLAEEAASSKGVLIFTALLKVCITVFKSVAEEARETIKSEEASVSACNLLNIFNFCLSLLFDNSPKVDTPYCSFKAFVSA